MQQLADDQRRSIQLPEGEATVGMTLPAVADRAGRFLGFDATGKLISVIGSDLAPDLSERTVLTTGATTVRPLRDKFRDTLSVRDFGAVGDGVTDDTQALRRAFAEAAGCTLLIPRGRYMVRNGDTGWGVTWTRQMRIIGDGPGGGWTGTVIFKDPAEAPSGSIISIHPEAHLSAGATNSSFGWHMEGIRLAGPNADYGLYIGLGAARFLAKATFRNNAFAPVRHWCFFQTKSMEDDDGFFTSIIEDNFFESSEGGGCIRLNRAGDSLTIANNTIAGPGQGLHMDVIAGAAMQIIRENNVTAGGGIVVEGGNQTKIINNQMEQVLPSVNGYGAQIYLRLGTSCEIRGNNLNNHGKAHNIRLADTTYSAIDGNLLNVYWSTPTDWKHLLMEGACFANSLGTTNQYIGAGGGTVTPSVVDATALPTIDLYKPLTLAGGWVAYGDASFVQGLAYRLNPDRSVSLRGQITGGSTAAGTTIATLPVGARPTGAAVRISARLLIGGGQQWVTWSFFVTVDGQIQRDGVVTPSPISFVSFDGARFDIA